VNEKKEFSPKLANFQGEDRAASFVWLSDYLMSTILSQNCAGGKQQKQYKITKMQILVTLKKAALKLGDSLSYGHSSD
jgi:hypothetical protein